MGPQGALQAQAADTDVCPSEAASLVPMTVIVLPSTDFQGCRARKPLTHLVAFEVAGSLVSGPKVVT